MLGESIGIKTLITWSLIILGAGATYGTLNKTVSDDHDEIQILQKTEQSHSETLNRVDYNIQIIAKKVGVTPLKKVENE